MDIDTVAARAVGSELTIIALGWLGSPLLGEPVEELNGAFGSSALGGELAQALRTFSRRSQFALNELGRRTNAAGEALLVAADQFDAIESALAMDPA